MTDNAGREYQIKAGFKVYGTFTVKAKSFDEALDQLCDVEIFTSYLGSPETYGFNTEVMARKGIKVNAADYDSDPSPTGPQQVPGRGRRWVYSGKDGDW